MKRLTRDQQIRAYMYIHKQDICDADRDMIECIQLGLAKYNPLRDIISITAKGTRELNSAFD